ncbi:MAG: nitrous oxide-stimulated promoter family protein [Spirochaetes bacterium]|nr:nitrous oxide-stimulated promoter family protein [Spirochaetota bacterium]
MERFITLPSYIDDVPAKLQREAETLYVMTRIYCSAKHSPDSGLCDTCDGLMKYAVGKLARCPLINDKPDCKSCTIHCYRATHREQVCTIMRYAGPRMLVLHPVRALRHLMKTRRSRKGDAERAE